MSDMTEVHAVAEGEVHAVTGHHPSAVFVRHRDDIIQSYDNIYDVQVAPQQQVAEGELLGYIKTPDRRQ